MCTLGMCVMQKSAHKGPKSIDKSKKIWYAQPYAGSTQKRERIRNSGKNKYEHKGH